MNCYGARPRKPRVVPLLLGLASGVSRETSVSWPGNVTKFTARLPQAGGDLCHGYGAMDGVRHILVVDDDADIRGLLSNFLARNGYRVSVAQNGAAMMQTLGTARIDLVVLDIMMPGEDGLSLCRRLRASGTMPIIMLTAVGGECRPDRRARDGGR